MILQTRHIILVVILALSILTESFAQGNGSIRFQFIHKANNRIIERDSVYENNSGEKYSVTKFKYYLSNLKAGEHLIPESYFLVNALGETSFRIDLPASTYKKISFMIGVDSTRNCSGAQTGALDPLNDMFWTWNTGYVMFKLEGSSPNSTADLQRIEHHIGGFRGPFKTMRHFEIVFPQGLEIKNNIQQDILVDVNLDKYWSGNELIQISKLPLIMTPGRQASLMADNLPSMFSLKSFTE